MRVRGCAEQDRGEHRGHRDDAHVLVVVYRARDVPLRHMRDLVREHAGEFVLVVRSEKEPGVHADEPARQGERVDLFVLDEEEVELEVAVVRAARELAAERTDVLREQGIVDDDARVAQLEHHAAAELRLAAFAQSHVGGTAEVRQLVVRIGGREAGREQCEQHEERFHDSRASTRAGPQAYWTPNPGVRSITTSWPRPAPRPRGRRL